MHDTTAAWSFCMHEPQRGELVLWQILVLPNAILGRISPQIQVHNPTIYLRVLALFHLFGKSFAFKAHLLLGNLCLEDRDKASSGRISYGTVSLTSWYR
jgi:hypothetical protein